MRTEKDLNWKVVGALAAMVVLAAMACSNAQQQGASGSAQSTGKGAVLPAQPGEPRSHTRKSDGTQCRLIRFEFHDETDDGSIAQLIAKPISRNSKVLKLKVFDDAPPKFHLLEHKISPYDAEPLLCSGLLCTVEWKYEPNEIGRKPVTKRLVALRLEPFSVRGTIVGINDDYVTLRARPTKNEEWPHLPQQVESSRFNRNREQARALKLRLRAFDDITKFRDLKYRPLELWNFAEGNDVEAHVILGRKEGILVALRAMTVEP